MMKKMKDITKIIINKDNLSDRDIMDIKIRVKAVLINSKNEVLLGYADNIYQFPGGHLEKDETLIEALNREVAEETGIILDINNIEPFACIIAYYKDFPFKNQNRKNEIYYYIIKTDKKIDLNNTLYTESEINHGYELRYIKMDNVIKELKSNASRYGDKKSITFEMIQVFEIIKKQF